MLKRYARMIAFAVPFALFIQEPIAQTPRPMPDNIFTISGFVPQFADTPAKLKHLRGLPPDKLITRTRNGKTVYLYADPNQCVCVYVGTPQAWQTYQNGGPPNYLGDTTDKPLPRFNPNRLVEEMNQDPYADTPGQPTMDDYLFGAPP
jgi:hypothetical protein